MKSKILLVDDDESIRQLIKAALSAFGIAEESVIECSTRDEAVKLLKKHGTSLDLVITDYNIPAGDEGVFIANCAKTLDPHLPVIMMSGILNDERQKRQMREICPADAFIGKPFNLKSFRQIVTECLANRTKPVAA